MAQTRITKTNRFIKPTGAPTPKSGQYVVTEHQERFVHNSKMPTQKTAKTPTEADWQRAALEVLDEHAGAWKRLADK